MNLKRLPDTIYGMWKEIVCCNAENSLLSRNESNAIKGVLIMLVVLGHNKYVMQGGLSNMYLYSFHVYAFYYLPFLYDFKLMSWGNFFKKNLRRLYIPYTVFFILLLVLSFLQGHPLSINNILITYICGSQNLLVSNLGFGSFLWFIPTMLSVLFFRQIYYRLGYIGRNVLLVISALCLVGFSYMLPIYVYTWWYSPFCLTVGLAMVFPAICLRWMFSRVRSSAIVLSFFILTLSILIFYPVRSEYYLTYLTINRIICPVLIFSLLLTLMKYLSQSEIIIKIGIQSFIIYLLHIFIYNAFYMLCDRYKPGIYEGLIIFVISLTIAYAISKIGIVRYAFPK